MLENWKKLWDMKVTVIPIVTGALGAVTKELVQGQRIWKRHQNDSIKIGKNTEKSPEDLKKLAVTQTPGKDHRLMLV